MQPRFCQKLEITFSILFQSGNYIEKSKQQDKDFAKNQKNQFLSIFLSSKTKILPKTRTINFFLNQNSNRKTQRANPRPCQKPEKQFSIFLIQKLKKKKATNQSKMLPKARKIHISFFQQSFNRKSEKTKILPKKNGAQKGCATRYTDRIFFDKNSKFIKIYRTLFTAIYIKSTDRFLFFRSH